MSDKLPDIPEPPTNEGESDIWSDLLEDEKCPICQIPLAKKTHDQWVRTYDGRELWLTDVHFMECTKCGSTVYPDETLKYFDDARDNPDNYKTRVYEPDEYEDEEEAAE